MKSITLVNLFFYGLPDFSHAVFGHIKKLEKFMTELIAFYEPRLLDVSVKVDDREMKQRKLHLEVQGMIQIGEHRVSVSFPLTIEQ